MNGLSHHLPRRQYPHRRLVSRSCRCKPMPARDAYLIAKPAKVVNIADAPNALADSAGRSAAAPWRMLSSLIDQVGHRTLSASP